MSADIVLKQMVLDAPGQIASITTSITNLNTQIADIQSKQDSLKNICDKVALDLETYLTATKFLPATDYFMYKGTNYNQNLSITGSIIDWVIYKILTVTGLLYIADDSFSCDSDKTSIFTTTTKVSFLLSGSRVYSTVLSSSFDGSITTVILNDLVLDITIASVWPIEYSYLAGDDTKIDEYKTNWDFSHDYITLPMGTTGTYGTLDNIAKLNLAKTLLTSNKTKLTDSITVLTPFI